MTEIATFDMTDLELRFVDTETGGLTGICVPYNKTTYKAMGRPEGERFLPGAFAKSIERRGPGKIRLTDFHQEPQQRRPYGVASGLRDTPDGLIGDWRFYDTPTGQEGRAEAKAGTYGGLSVGFQVLKERVAADGVREVVEAALHHVSLVDEPAYDDAVLLAVRAKTERSPYADWTPPEETLEIPNVMAG